MQRRIFNQTSNPINDSCICAVGIVGSTHSGIFYLDPVRKKHYLLHLVVGKLVDQDATYGKKYLWGSPDIPEQRKGDFVAKAMLIRDKAKTKDIPYGYSSPVNFFDNQSGEIIKDNRNVGLTCSTLILAIFHMIGISIIDYSSWIYREEDKIKQLYYLEYMKKEGFFTKEHREKVKQQIEGFRYRPEEVVAAAVTPNEIRTMAELEPLGKEIVSMLSTSS